MNETYIQRIGIVDAVKAKRKDSSEQREVMFLTATVRFETELETGANYGDKHRTDVVEIAVGAREGVNPGDLVAMTLTFTSPTGQRFQPALEVGEDVETYELDDDDEG